MKNSKSEKLSSITDSELVTILSRQMNISPTRAKNIIDIFVDCFTKCIEMNGVVNVRKLGRFLIKQRRKARFKNFRGEVIEIPILYSLKFYSSPTIRRIINVRSTKIRDEARKNIS